MTGRYREHCVTLIWSWF